MRTLTTDIVIVGSGIAGINAAIETIKNNKTILISSGEFCSGASFYPGTWGLGMVVAENNEDKEDFIQTIMEVGCDIPKKNLVSVMVDKARDGIKELEAMGIKFRRPIDKEKVIPCFDKKSREWYGFDFESAKQVFLKLRDNKNLHVIEYTNLIKINKNKDNAFESAIFIMQDGEYLKIEAKSIIIASGGFTNIYKYNLSTNDMGLNSHIPAMEAGCKLINMEFIQFIPAYINPYYKTIFNERVFNYIKLKENISEEILKERSTHGPFTSRLNSKCVDINMFKQYLKTRKGTSISYPENISEIKDTLIYNYFKWLGEKETSKEDIIILPFAHAANGGIEINEKAETSIKGIYAAGEVTGGVHGADRIGGLSTVNAMVFGKIAGKEATKYIKGIKSCENSKNVNNNLLEYFSNKNKNSSKLQHEEIENYIKEIKNIMYDNASIVRNPNNINNAIKNIYEIKNKFNVYDYLKEKDISKRALILNNYIEMALVILKSILNRKESKGSHYIEN